jgi:hypothetical protein
MLGYNVGEHFNDVSSQVFKVDLRKINDKTGICGTIWDCVQPVNSYE